MKKFWKERKTILLWGLGIIILALALRVNNLNALPVFADEAIYVRWAQIMRAENTLRFLPLSDGKQPLYMWSVIPFLKIFADPLIAGRMVSVISGLLNLVGIFVTVNLLFKSSQKALLAALVYGVSSYSVFFDRMALVDSMLTMFGVWTFIFGILAVRHLRWDFAMLAGFSLGGALITKSPALFFTLLIPSIVLLSSWPKVNNRPALIRHLLKLGGIYVTIYLIAYLMYNILRLGPNFQMLTSRNYDYVFPYSHILTEPFNPFLAHLGQIGDWFVKLGPAPILLLAVLGIVSGLKKHTRETVLLLIWFLFPILVQAEYAKVFTARYLLFSLPYLVMLSAIFWGEITSKHLKWVYLPIALFVGLSLYQDVLLIKNPQTALLPAGERSGYLEEWTAGTGISEVAVYLRQIAQNNPQQTIVVGTEGAFGTLPDGLQIYLNNNPMIIVKGLGMNLSEVDESLRQSRAAGNPTYFVVNSSRLGIKDYSRAGLKLLSSYPKAQKPDKTRESLLFFELK